MATVLAHPQQCLETFWGATQRVKNREGKTFFVVSGPVTADIFVWLFFWVAYACKSKNVESTVNINNVL